MSLVKIASVGLVVLAAACSSTAPREKTGRNEPSSASIAGEVKRICALPAGEREKALEKLKQESGMVLFCGSKE